MSRAVLVHLAVLAVLFALQFVVDDYHHLTMTRVMLLATYAVGFNLLFGYTGLLSLGHALFFASGLYGAGLTAVYWQYDAGAAFAAGVGAGFVMSVVAGAIALRTTGVAFMIVTLMFAQAGFLATLHFGSITRGDEGLVIPDTGRRFEFGGFVIDLADATMRYNAAFALLAFALILSLVIVRRPIGRVMVAIRENEARTTMLGYDTTRTKLFAVVVSGTLSAAAGAAYALSFAYIGSTFAGTQYSIYPLLWTLLGGAGTVLGPVLGTLLMFHLVDIASGYTSAHLVVVGAAILLTVLLFPKGLLGSLRDKVMPWLP